MHTSTDAPPQAGRELQRRTREGVRIVALRASPVTGAVARSLDISAALSAPVLLVRRLVWGDTQEQTAYSLAFAVGAVVLPFGLAAVGSALCLARARTRYMQLFQRPSLAHPLAPL